MMRRSNQSGKTCDVKTEDVEVGNDDKTHRSKLEGRGKEGGRGRRTEGDWERGKIEAVEVGNDVKHTARQI